MHTLNFRRLKDDPPADEAEIFYIHTSKFYGSYEFRCAKVELQWLELDEDGHPTGTCFLYEASESQPPNTKLLTIVNGTAMDENTLWIPASEVDAMLDSTD